MEERAFAHFTCACNELGFQALNFDAYRISWKDEGGRKWTEAQPGYNCHRGAYVNVMLVAMGRKEYKPEVEYSTVGYKDYE